MATTTAGQQNHAMITNPTPAKPLNLNSPRECVKFYRAMMRRHALQWRQWANGPASYAEGCLRSARWNRDAANFHASKLNAELNDRRNQPES